MATAWLATGQHLLSTAQALQSSATPLDLPGSVQAWLRFVWVLSTSFKPPAAAGTPEKISDLATPLQLSLMHQVRVWRQHVSQSATGREMPPELPCMLCRSACCSVR